MDEITSNTKLPIKVLVRCGINGTNLQTADILKVNWIQKTATIQWEARRGTVEDVTLDRVTKPLGKRIRTPTIRFGDPPTKKTKTPTTTRVSKPRPQTPKKETTVPSLSYNESSDSSSTIDLLSDDDSIEDTIETMEQRKVNNNNKAVTVTSKQSTNCEEGGEVTFLKSSGPNALKDFPHCREHCLVHLFSNSNTQQHALHCRNCYCYVCDDVVSNCQQWNESHCHARHKDPYWKRMRALHKKQKTNPLEDVDPTVPLSTFVYNRGVQSSLDRFFNTNRPKQPPLLLRKQSAAPPTMQQQQQQRQAPKPTVSQRTPLAPIRSRQQQQQQQQQQVSQRTVSQQPPNRTTTTTTRKTVRKAIQATPPPEKGIPDNDGEDETSTEELCSTQNANNSTMESVLHQITIHHSIKEVSPPPFVFKTNLRNYQRQSLAFMQDLENETSCGGWVSSDVGMGKSAIVIALVATDLQHQFKTPPQHSLQYQGKQKVNVTVVLTSASLMGQWEDECQKHAPSLKVRRYHPSSRSRVSIDLRNGMSSIRDLACHCDILISTATFAWPDYITNRIEFHRVVMDEAHLLSNSNAGANVLHAMKLKATRKWCVTATPITSHPSDLMFQMRFLGIPYLLPLYHAVQSYTNSNTTNKQQLLSIIVKELRKRMTRHLKTSIMNGSSSQALSLPSNTTKNIYLTMSPLEKTKYQGNITNSVHKWYTRQRQELKQQRMNPQQEDKSFSIFTLQQNLFHPLSSDVTFDTWKESTKIQTLVQDLKTMQKENFHLRVVVFTQYRHTHTQVCQALKKFFIIPVVYEITGSTSSTARDFAIRCFQGTERSFPSALVVTLKAGSVGMTLTAASCLYLMEPSIDQAAEQQAMGRIHRFGQDKPTTVKKFVFRDSVEENIEIFHNLSKNGHIKLSNTNRIPIKGFEVLTRGLDSGEKRDGPHPL